MLKLDRLFTWIVCALVILAPLAFGTVYPWAYRLAEAAAFAAGALWMLKLAVLAQRGDSPAPENRALMLAIGVPLGLLLVLVAVQLVPMPPGLLRVISPATYDLYSRAFPDWPARAPYAGMTVEAGAAPAVTLTSNSVVLPTEQEISAGAPIPFAPATLTVGPPSANVVSAPMPLQPTGVARLFSDKWRPLAVAWPLTITGLGGAFAIATLLLAVCFYPFGSSAGPSDSSRFIRAVLMSMIAACVMVALVGLIEVATWNGRVLWIMVPFDWGKPLFDEAARRARGPFVNPDHFAGYLAMLFPLLLSLAVFGGFPAREGVGPGARVTAAIALFLAFAAVALSQSRAGWLGVAVGTILLVTLVLTEFSRREEGKSASAGARALRLSLSILSVMLLLTLFFVGTQGRHLTAQRLGSTVTGVDLRERLVVWARSLVVFREFPLFGVGLGGWPAIFHHFQPPPHVAVYFNRAHNDYLQMLVEIGAIGMLLLGWLLVRAALRLRAGLAAVSEPMLPAYAALLSALVVIGVVESFDFDLQIPANLILFVTILGLALRMSLGQIGVVSTAQPKAWAFVRLVPAAFATVAGILAIVLQEGPPYPYNLGHPIAATLMMDQLVGYPTEPAVHLTLLDRYGASLPPGVVSHELAAAAWLDSTDPRAHDLYARDLIDHGDRDGAAREIAVSVYASPETNAHEYLEPRIVPWLPDDQKRAIEESLRRAVAAGFPHAGSTLGAYYDALDRSPDSAAVSLAAATHEPDPARRAELFCVAGDSYLKSGMLQKAGEVFRRAIESDPESSEAYIALISRVLVPYGEYDDAHQLVAQATQSGADACRIAIAFSDGAQNRGRSDVAEQALGEALSNDASSFECTLELGKLYAREGRDARAVLVLKQAATLNPDSVDAWMTLGSVAERSYDYFTAEKAYDEAERLAPHDREVTVQVSDFKRKMTEPAATAASVTQ
ncbi:MAG TPA: O-antigen ligase family protein [Candidatus Binataceae bacterium]|nr:O-antigen ligase family protein [Candidatus Binataceae bacterium]